MGSKHVASQEKLQRTNEVGCMELRVISSATRNRILMYCIFSSDHRVCIMLRVICLPNYSDSLRSI
jgi:hypothetical protein